MLKRLLTSAWSRRSASFPLLLVAAGLGALGLLTFVALDGLLGRWFDQDLRQRGRLAIAGLSNADEPDGLPREPSAAVLERLVRDERVVAAAACSSAGGRAATAAWPDAIDCADLASRRARADADRIDRAGEWHGRMTVNGADLHVSVLPLDSERPAGPFVALVQSYALLEARRRALVGVILVAALLAGVASAVAGRLVARVLRRGLIEDLRRLVGQGASRVAPAALPHPDFTPLARDLKELSQRLVHERESPLGGPWTPERLQRTASTLLPGVELIVVANREPYIHERTDDGPVRLLRPASGLVTALEPVLRACSGTWIAHGSGSADRETSDAHGRLRVPPGEESYTLRRAWIPPELERGYYYGTANEGLWPLCHLAHERPVFRADDWEAYRRVNETFARLVCEEAGDEAPVVLVQDYHFALLPRLLRERLPDATIVTFWHVPWPNAERFGIAPWASEILDGLLGSSILGFHTQAHCNNFCESVDRHLEARIDREAFTVTRHGQATAVRAYPISVEWPYRRADESAPPSACRRAILDELQLPADTRLIVGVDRVDYTKGLLERFRAVERLIELFPSLRGRVTLVQAAAPSRTAIESYRRLGDEIESEASRINARLAGRGAPPIVLRRRHHDADEVAALMRSADACYVSSLHDGMNLVAKEFVACRDDERGVLVLSSLAGASKELAEALVVNPYDLDMAARALHAALAMPPGEQARRMRLLRSHVAEFNVYRWAGRMLTDAARLRRRSGVAPPGSGELAS